MSSILNNNQSLSRKNRKLLLDISIATGNTADELLYQQYNNTTVEYARGYLSAIAITHHYKKYYLLILY